MKQAAQLSSISSAKKFDALLTQRARVDVANGVYFVQGRPTICSHIPGLLRMSELESRWFRFHLSLVMGMLFGFCCENCLRKGRL